MDVTGAERLAEAIRGELIQRGWPAFAEVCNWGLVIGVGVEWSMPEGRYLRHALRMGSHKASADIAAAEFLEWARVTGFRRAAELGGALKVGS